MQREKTVIDVEVSEEKKQALFNSLVREHTKAQLKIEMEQEKQSQQVRFIFWISQWWSFQKNEK